MAKKDEKAEPESKKEKSLADTLGMINQQYGKDTIMRASEAQALRMERIPSRVPAINLVLGGGWPRARIVKVQGAFSTGKTLLSLDAMAQFQQHCRVCGKWWEKFDLFTGEELEPDCTCDTPTPMEGIWVDVEKSWDNEWSRKRGVDLDRCYVIQPEYTEQALDVTDLIMRSKKADIVVIDSVAALSPQEEVKASCEDWQVGLQARLVNKAMRKYCSAMNSVGLNTLVGCPTVLLINQIRTDIKKKFGSKDVTPGGRGQDFHSSVTLRMATRGLIKMETGRKVKGYDGKKVNEEVIVGQHMGADAIKNKTAAPHKSGVFDFYFADHKALGIRAGDIDMGAQWFSLGMRYGLIKLAGAWYGVSADADNDPNDTLGQGQIKAQKNLLQRPELCREIWQRACLAELGKVP